MKVSPAFEASHYSSLIFGEHLSEPNPFLGDCDQPVMDLYIYLLQKSYGGIHEKRETDIKIVRKDSRMGTAIYAANIQTGGTDYTYDFQCQHT
jgi:hypothetical protein